MDSWYLALALLPIAINQYYLDRRNRTLSKLWYDQRDSQQPGEFLGAKETLNNLYNAAGPTDLKRIPRSQRDSQQPGEFLGAKETLNNL
jgi:hypothetical protein